MKITLVTTLASVIAALTLLVGCGDDAEEPTPAPPTAIVPADEVPTPVLADLTVDESAAGTTVRVESGQVIAVTLESNPTTGYRWEIDAIDETVLRKVGESHFAPQSSALGAPGTETLQFEAVADGQNELKLIYHRSFEPGVAPLRTYTLQVAVGEVASTLPAPLCAVTEAMAFDIPMIAVRGQDPVPSGFDSINRAQCSFEKPIASVTLELLRDGVVSFSRVVPLASPASQVSFPVDQDVESMPADVATGGYDRRIVATAADGSQAEVRSDAGWVWVIEPGSMDPEGARGALSRSRIELSDELQVGAYAPVLTTLEALQWSDSSLGCPQPDMMYAQVITHGFKVVFDHEGKQYEYHTNGDGSSIVLCD